MSLLFPNAYRGAAPTGTGTVAVTPIDRALDALDGALAAVGCALRERDAGALQIRIDALQAALGAALPRLLQPLHRDDLKAARPRVVAASARLAAQRDCVARERAGFERGLALLIPSPEPSSVYGTPGQAERPATRGSLYA